jgi:hypothetical protein
MINAMKRRRLLIIIIGIRLLVLLTSLATSLDTFFPPKPTAAVQIANVSPYQITLSVAPNPPNTAKPATLSFQIATIGERCACAASSLYALNGYGRRSPDRSSEISRYLSGASSVSHERHLGNTYFYSQGRSQNGLDII